MAAGRWLVCHHAVHRLLGRDEPSGQRLGAWPCRLDDLCPGGTQLALPDPAGPLEILRRVAAGLLLGPLAGLAALALSTAGFVALQRSGAEHTANLITAMFALPLLWAAIAVIAGAQSRLWRKSVIVIGAGLAPAAYLGLSV